MKRMMVICVFLLFSMNSKLFSQGVTLYQKTLKTYQTSVYLKDGSILSVNSPLYYTASIGGFYLKDNDNKIYPSMTDSLLIDNIIGYSSNNYWLFRDNSVKKNLYLYSMYPDGLCHYIGKPNSEILKYTTSNIEQLVSDNKNALSEVLHYKTEVTIKYSLVALSGILLVKGITNLPKGGTDKDITELDAMNWFIGSGISLSLMVIPHMLSKNRLQNAIDIYNK